MLTERRKCAATALGDEAASGRFRVFREGWIKTDHGMSLMTPKAGAEVIRKFRERGNDMMIDLRHFSISPNATREQSEAMGWIPCPNGLEYVDGDGLYAVNVQWMPEVKAGLECKPPRWKYFSPYYDQDKRSKVITALLNVALTNMPATHGLNRLAAEMGGRMDLVEAGKALLGAMALADGGDEKAIMVRDALIAALGDQAEAAIDAAKAAMGSSEEVEAGSDEVTAGMDEDEKKAYEALPDGMKATYVAGIKAMRAGAEDKSVAAESDKKDEVAAGAEPDKVAAGMLTVDLLQKIHAGETAQSQGARQKMVAEARAKGLVSESMATLLLDPSKTTEKVAAEFIASRKVVTRSVPGPFQTRIGAEKPAAKSETTTISAEQRKQTERLSGKLGTDPKKVLAKLMELG